MNKIIKIVSCITIIICIQTGFALAADQVFFYYTDPAGTPLAVSDASGNVVWKADYMPFGEELLDTASVENNKMFVGKEKDKETGFYYFGARYMEPMIGRFISIDPAGPVDSRTGKINDRFLLNPQRLNRYAYAGNNPYAFIDPLGLEFYFSQDTGRIVYFSFQSLMYIDFGTVAVSGNGLGWLNGSMQNVPSVGPIVTGIYTIGDMMSDYTFNSGSRKGQVTHNVMTLTPDDQTTALIRSFKRNPKSFLFHDFLSSCICTEGCIATSDGIRQAIWSIIQATGDRKLIVKHSLTEDSMNNNSGTGAIGWDFPNINTGTGPASTEGPMQ